MCLFSIVLIVFLFVSHVFSMRFIVVNVCFNVCQCFFIAFRCSIWCFVKCFAFGIGIYNERTSWIPFVPIESMDEDTKDKLYFIIDSVTQNYKAQQAFR